MATTTKKEIIDRIADKTKVHRDQVKVIVTEFLDSLIVEIGKGNRLEFRDFGVFEVRVRPPRQAQNPKTLAPVMVDRKPTVKFKVGRLMREALDRADLDTLVEAKPRRRKMAQASEVKGGSSASPAGS
jgi:integration host factor subunit beta